MLMNDRRILGRVCLFFGASACCATAALAGGRDMLLIVTVPQPTATMSSLAPASVDGMSVDPTPAAAFDEAFRRRMTGGIGVDASGSPTAIEAQPSSAGSPADPFPKEMLDASLG